MEYLYIVFLTLFVTICCLKCFDITVSKDDVLLLLLIAFSCCVLNFVKLINIVFVLRVCLIYLLIRRNVLKDRAFEVLTIILILEMIGKCSYYLIVLFIPLIIQTNISNILLYNNYEFKIISLFMIFIIMMMYYRSSYFINVRCNRITYILLSTCSLISLYGLEVIAGLVNQIEEKQLYFLLLSFIYLVVVNIIIYLYHNRQTQQDIENKIILEQARILKQEKAILSIQNKMIDSIKHDLNYFKDIVNDNKDYLNETIKKIDEYNSIFVFKDYLLNNFIVRLKTEIKDNGKDLKLIVSNTNITISLKIYNQLIEMMEVIIDDSLEEIIQLSIKVVGDIKIFEFSYVTNNEILFKNNANVVFKRIIDNYFSYSLVIEGDGIDD